MTILKKRILAASALFLLTGTCLAQGDKPKEQARPAKFYRLDFVIKELEEGKTLNARAYSMLMSTDRGSAPSQIRAGSRLSIPNSTPPSPMNYGTYEVGANLDCRASHPQATELIDQLQLEKYLALVVSAEISSLAGTLEGTPPGLPPVIRQNKWSSDVIVPIGKPTTIFSSDDAAGKRKMQVELTATQIIK